MSTVSAENETPVDGPHAVSETIVAPPGSEGIVATETKESETRVPMATSDADNIKKEKTKRKPETANGNGHSKSAETVVKTKKSKKANEPGVAMVVEKPTKKKKNEFNPELWTLMQLTLDMPWSKHARTWLRRQLKLINVYPALKKKIYKALFDVSARKDIEPFWLLPHQARLLAFVVRGAPVPLQPFTPEIIKILESKQEPADLKYRSYVDTYLDDTIKNHELLKNSEVLRNLRDQFTIPPDLIHTDLRTMAREWIEKYVKKNKVAYFADTKESDAGLDRPLETRPDDPVLPVTRALYALGKQYLYTLCDLAGVPVPVSDVFKPWPALALRNLEKPSVFWEHMLQTYALHVTAIRWHLEKQPQQKEQEEESSSESEDGDP